MKLYTNCVEAHLERDKNCLYHALVDLKEKYKWAFLRSRDYGGQKDVFYEIYNDLEELLKEKHAETEDTVGAGRE